MDRIVYGKIAFDIKVIVDCLKNELEHEICERTSELFFEMEPEFLLRKLLNDSNVKVDLTEADFFEVD